MGKEQADMESGANAAEVLIDLLGSILKFLGRPVIQQQLLLGLFAIVLAWGVARWIVSRMHRQQVNRREVVHKQVRAEVRARLDEIDDQDAANANSKLNGYGTEETVVLDEQAELALLLEDEQALGRVVAERRGSGSRLYALIQQALFPGWGCDSYPLCQLCLCHLRGMVRWPDHSHDPDLLNLLFIPARLRYCPCRGRSKKNRLLSASSLRPNNSSHRHPAGAECSRRSGCPVLCQCITPGRRMVLTLGTIFVVTFGFYIWIMSLNLLKDFFTECFWQTPQH